MTHWLNLSRAAHLLGESRSALQRKIQDGALPSHDGMVSTDDLLRVFPDAPLENSGAFERITQIKDQAFARRVRERILPSQEVLASRLFAQGQELADLRRHLARYHDLIEALQEKLAAPVDRAGLAAWLDDALGRVLASSDSSDTMAIMDDMLRVVAAQVTVKPSGHTFFVEGSETILDAALRAGLAPSYGCGNGNCGLCKGRIVSGEVRATGNCDYALSAAEKSQNYTLLCAHTAVTDLVVEMLEARQPEDIPLQEIVAKVRSVTALDEHTLLLHLQTPRSSRLRFLAGQSVTLGLPVAEVSAELPIASCPCDDRNLLFHVRRGSAFAEVLFSGRLLAGKEINVRGPQGDFVLDRDERGPLFFACCDGGFAPAKSLVEHAVAGDAVASIQLWWAATGSGGHYLANQCRAWSEALDGFAWEPLRADDADSAGQTVAACLAARAELDQAVLFLSGPSSFLEAVDQGLRRLAKYPRKLLAVPTP